MKPPMPAILRGDARSLPLPDQSVDLIVTSPPYFGLRSYQDGGEHYDGQIGAETTPGEFVDALIDCTREWMRVLKPTGSLFVNLGDGYASRSEGFQRGARDGVRQPWVRPVTGVTPKSLFGVPWRYAIRCVDELGLVLRQELIWSKPNGLPESVTDRCRRSHEQWFHFTTQRHYYAAVDEIREPHAREWGGKPNGGHTYGQMKAPGEKDANLAAAAPNSLGKLPGSVWEIATQPLKVPASLGVDHFAAFPMEWPRRLIQGWSPREVCTACGEGRRPVADRSMGADAQGRTGTRHGGDSARLAHSTERKMLDGLSLRTITGYACACTPRTSHRGKRGDWREVREVMPDHRSDDFHSPGNAVPRRPGGFGTKVAPSDGVWQYHLDEWTPPPTTPGVVLDPFGGTGTTALVATMLGRRGISLDLSADYCRLAEWRATDPKERARAAGLDPDAVSKVPTQLPGQESLLDLLDGTAS